MVDRDLLARARQMASRLTDAQLANELEGDKSTLQPEAWDTLREEARRRSKASKAPSVSTTDTFDPRVKAVLGVVGSEYVLGVDLIQEFLAGVRDIIGGRSETIQNAFATAREALLRELSEKGRALRADAVLGVSFSLSEWSGQNKSMLILLASGKAVEFHDPEGTQQ